MRVMAADCVFCRIVAGEVDAYRIHETDRSVVFLDSSPLFPGHCLVCPKIHYDTLMDVPSGDLTDLFRTTQVVARALERGLGAGGSLVAVNNRVSQSVPHLHVHVSPRNRGDGLKGFFWPRRPYRDKQHAEQVQTALRAAIPYVLSDD